MKGIVAAIFALGTAIAADQQYYAGLHTQTALTMLRAMRRAFFGW